MLAGSQSPHWICTSLRLTNMRYPLKRFQAKHALGLDPGVETGSRQENASNQESRAPFRFYRNEALARRHAKRGIEPHHLAIQVWIVDHVQRQRGELVGMPEPARKRYRRGEAVLRLLRQIG